MTRSLVLALALLATGCSTTPDSGAPSSHQDQDQMSAVEGAAMARGIRVYWVNPPQKPETKQSGG